MKTLNSKNSGGSKASTFQIRVSKTFKILTFY